MKKVCSLFVVISIFILAGFSVSVSAAETYIENGYSYTVDENGNAMITDTDDSFSGDITVPSSLGGYQVTALKSAFARNDNITSVSIPEGVAYLDGFCFLECNSLKTIYLPSTLESMSSIAIYKNASLESIIVNENSRFYVSDENGLLYSADMKTLVKYPDGRPETSFTVPDSVVIIAADAFSYVQNLTEITFSDNVEYVNDDAFHHSKSLETVNFNNKLKSIGASAFENADMLKVVSLPDSLTSLGKSAFYGCGALTEISISDGVTSLGEKVLSTCPSLERISIGSSVSTIADTAFEWAHSLVEFNVSANNSYFKSTDGVLFNKAGTELISFPCANVKYTYRIPDGVTHIRDGAFSTNKEIRTVIFPDTVISIGEKCFYNSEKLNYVEISSSVSSIGVDAFRYCPILSEFVVDENNEYFYSDSAGALVDKHNKKLLCFPAMAYVFEYTVSEDVTEICAFAFDQTAYLEKVIIPDNVTTIPTSAFDYCYNITEIEIGNGVSDIGTKAFSLCISLVKIVVSEENPYFTSVDGILFDKEITTLYKYPEMREIKSVVFPDTVSVIADYAFYGADVENVVFPASVKKIGDTVFGWKYNLKTVAFLNNEIDISKYASINSSAVIYAYENSTAHTYAKENGKKFVAFYEDADFTYDGGIVTVSGANGLSKLSDPLVYPWNHFAQATEVLIMENIPSVASGCFNDFYGLTTIVFKGDSVRLSSSAFSGCYSLATVVSFCDSNFSGRAFADTENEIMYFSEVSKTKPTLEDVVQFRQTGTIVRFDSSVAMTAYEFFNLVVVMCDSLDDVYELRFAEFTAEDFVIERLDETGAVEEINSFTDSGFIAKVYNDNDELEQISFNELCELAANDELFMFKLVVKDANDEEAGSADVQADENIFMYIFRALITFFNKILRLFRR